MNKQLFFLLISLAFVPALFGQCPFVPTVSPGDLILCPGSGDTLRTQAYDSYQWLRDGQALPGETAQKLAVDAFSFGGSQVQVIATLNGCTDTSAAVLVDGWVFLLPYVIIETNCMYDPTMEAWRCSTTDTMKLTLGDPFDTLITWQNYQNPIPGANAEVYYVTATGSYTVSGSPLICPGYSQTTDVPVDVFFVNKNEAPVSALLEVQPNPARDWVAVRYPAQSQGILRLIAADGREVQRQAAGEMATRLALDGLQPGVYALLLETVDGQLVARTMLVHVL